ncbi:ribonuclease Oy [Galendromus occidentalis]|uniref:Ribonuclease Oy n=1 Tax=Galendromus occidentalis TaxID=34638 RepID=A0AAJ6QPR9_9ACAR|nr:ribonuclease Oy [Galendromus occidentalis]
MLARMMSAKFRALFCLSSFVAASGQSVRVFSHYTLAVQHGAGICYENPKCVRSSALPQYPEWTIHGLWPSNLAFCGGSKFDLRELGGMLPTLRESWPSFTETGDSAFWRYQFTKHGTCAIGSPRISGVQTYFERSLALYEDFSQKVLRKIGIRAGIVDVSEVEGLIRSRLGKSVQMRCRIVGSHYVLSEIKICYSRWNFEVIDCPRKSNCGRQSIFVAHGSRGPVGMV